MHRVPLEGPRALVSQKTQPGRCPLAGVPRHRVPLPDQGNEVVSAISLTVGGWMGGMIGCLKGLLPMRGPFIYRLMKLVWSTWIGVVGFWLLGGAEPLLALPQTEAETVSVARGWLRTATAPLESQLSGRIDRVTPMRNEAGDLLFYLVNLAPEGFLLVAADTETEPILGFSAHGSAAENSASPLFSFAAQDTAARLDRARSVGEGDAIRRAQTAARWERFKRLGENRPVMFAHADDDLSAVDDLRVAPFMATRWNQGSIWGGTNWLACFNYYTPPYEAGNSSNYVAGCNSTAWAQIMRYFKYPTQAVGANAFNIKVDGLIRSWRLRGGDGLGGAYPWNQMPLVPGPGISVGERQALGALTADIGAVSATEYVATGSGSYLDSTNLLNFINVFHYSNAILGGKLDGNFAPRVHPNLDAGIPVFLSLDGDSSHGLVCDGYGYQQSTLYHHLNLGWGGAADAWYHLPDVETEWGNFTNLTLLYFNIYTNGTGEIISGRVADTNSVPLPNAVVQAVGGGQTRTSVSNGRGIYAFSRLPSNTAFTLTVTREGFSFPSQSVSTYKSDIYGNVGNKWGVNFAGTPSNNLQLISGRVTDQQGSPLSDVVLTFGNGVGKATTDVTGIYLKTVAKGWTGTVTPSGTSWVFDPPWRSYGGVTNYWIRQDYRATQVVFVNRAAIGLNDGTSWTNAFTNLQSAIARATVGAEIWVAQGTYYPGLSRSNLFLCPATVPLYGGFTGTESSRSQRDWEVHPAILSGDIGALGDWQDNVYHVVKGVNGGRLDGFTVTGGNANHPTAWDLQEGGGIYCDWWNTTNFLAVNCRITGNVAVDTGGGGFAGTYVNCTVVSNIARLGGGLGLAVTTNCWFQGNRATAGGGAYSSTNFGSRFLLNNATNLGGGGMTCVFDGCLFSNNVSSSAGGGYSHSWATNCLVLRNVTGSLGGGAHLSTNVNCTIVENTAVVGGGINDGVAINTILWNNVASYQSNNYSVATLSYSCTVPLSPGVGNITNSPLFLNPTNGDYRPAPESGCVDRGQVQPWMTNAVDFAGRPRLHRFLVDMGAFELEVNQPSLACSPDTLTFYFPAGATNVPAQSLAVWNAGVGTLNYTLSSSAGWVSPASATGSSAGESNLITVQVSRTGLSEGLYTGTITLLATNALVSQRTVNVSLRVLPDYGVNLETTGLVWISEGDAPWRRQTAVSHDGIDAVASGAIGDGQTSVLRTSVTGPGLLTFWWRVSSQYYYDWLKLSLDAQEIAHISGEIAWQKFSLNVPPGLHSVEWTYTKDKAGISGQDTAWLDQVSYVVAPSLVQARRMGNGAFQLFLPCVSGQPYYLEYKNALTNGAWNSLPVTLGNGTLLPLVDSNANTPQRFYRVRLE
jgi:hypothetical protein